MKKFKHLYDIINQKILAHGLPWSRYIILKDVLKVSKNDNLYVHTRKELLQHSHIKNVYQRLHSPVSGTASLHNIPADFKIYGSYYWGLRFFADLELSNNDLMFDKIVEPVFLYQLPDGQFTVTYKKKNKIPVSAVCFTAHLVYSLISLGYMEHKGVRAALNYILTSRRNDGGWHCDMNKQKGERDEHTISCPSASLYVLKVLTFVDDCPGEIIHSLIQTVISNWHNNRSDLQVCDSGICKIYNKLRYPSHYHGYDFLNILDTLSLFPDYFPKIEFESMLDQLYRKWHPQRFFKSEKTIPGWKDFDFAQRNSYSCWISALIARILSRYFLKNS